LQARILGIDPGSQATGYGVVEHRDGKLVHVAHGTLRASRDASPERRLADLHRCLLEVIEHHRPELASVEQVFVARGARSALVLGQARGVALAAIGAAGLAVHEYAPARIKQSVTGNGRASKLQVQRVVKRLLSLERAPAADAADALAAALCHAQAGRLERLGVRTRSRRRPAARASLVRVDRRGLR
jgi:crossover junction endodeoxyribonuclease RuvC